MECQRLLLKDLLLRWVVILFCKKSIILDVRVDPMPTIALLVVSRLEVSVGVHLFRIGASPIESY